MQLILCALALVSCALAKTDENALQQKMTQLRANVQPTAKSMNLVKYQLGLENAVITWLTYCGNVTTDYWNGLAYSGMFSSFPNDTLDESQMFDTWAQQGASYDYNSNKCSSKDGCEQYKALVYDYMTDFGCAKHTCADKGLTYFGCSFMPYFKLGADQKPYVSGKSCSGCYGECQQNQCAEPQTSTSATVVVSLLMNGAAFVALFLQF